MANFIWNPCEWAPWSLIWHTNSLSNEGCSSDFKNINLKCVILTTFMSISRAIAFRRIGQETNEDMSTLIRVMAWCWKATSNYLNQCWLRPVMTYIITRPQGVNSLAPGKFEWNFRYVIFKLILGIDGWGLFCEIVLIWMSLDFTDDQSTLVHVMAWCRQATSHYVSQCWPRSLSPYGITRPQWVNGAHTQVYQYWMTQFLWLLICSGASIPEVS